MKDFPNPFEQELPHHEMILVEGGSFQMGNTDEDAYGDEQPVHTVRVPSFWIGKYPITQALCKAVMGEEHNPSFFRGDARPVETVSWEDTQKFIQRLIEQTGRQGYRLPTEAEWEYAARGGKYWKEDNYKYAGSDKLKEVGWFEENSHGETKAVGLKMPNQLGIHDMSGNVWEWCEDQWHDNYKGAPADGSAWVDREEGSSRVYRGGSWNNSPLLCRVSSRFNFDPQFRYGYRGFRLVWSPSSSR